MVYARNAMMKSLTVFEELMKHIKVEDPTIPLKRVVMDLHENLTISTVLMHESKTPIEWNYAASQWWSAQVLLFSYRWHQ